MDFHNFLRSRRSIRRFQPTKIGIDIITRILETATYAPSAHNRQPWRFAVITQSNQKYHLSDMLTLIFHRDLAAQGIETNEIEFRIARSRERIATSPVIIILCMDMSEMNVFSTSEDKFAYTERTMAIQSVACAGLQLQLAAHAEGLSSVWTCSPLFAQDIVRSTLDLPEKWEPQAMFFLGYASETPKEKYIKPIQDVVRFL